MDKNIKNSLESLKKEIQKIKKQNCPLSGEIGNLYNLYEQTVLMLVLSKNTPDSVKEYVSCYGTDHAELPKEYSVLSEYNSLIRDLRPVISKKLSKSAKEAELKEIIDDVSNYSLFDYDHLHFVASLEKRILKKKITLPLIKFYKELFFRTSETSYLEKIGDLYFKLKDYDNALENYFNFAEVTEPTVRIYKKMAEVFTELNDIDSKNMCLEQARILEGNNV